MARCKITPRKRVVVRPPQIPEGINWAIQPVLEAHSSGLHAGYFPKTLWYLLQGLGYHDAPLYIGTRTPLRGRGYMWRVHVILYEKATDDGMRRTRRIHYATAPRATFDAGIRDAARQALAVLRFEMDSSLRVSQFAHFPRRASGSLEVAVLPAASTDTADRLREQVCLTTALDRELTMALDEIEELHARNDEQEERIRQLMEMLADQDPEEEEDPEEAPEPDMVPPSSPTRVELLLKDSESQGSLAPFE